MESYDVIANQPVVIDNSYQFCVGISSAEAVCPSHQLPCLGSLELEWWLRASQ
uniref:ARP1 actin-related protein 1A, centractin alpha n=1 Tax=Mus musculus TaxID=10090 RepID=A0A494B9R6_MOUSE